MAKTWARLGGWSLVALGLGLGAWLARRDARADDEAATGAVPSMRVELETVGIAAVRSRHVAHGVTRPTDRAMLSFAEGGRVVARPIQVGQRVRAGEVVARLDPAPYRNAVRAASASRRELELRSEQLGRDRDRAERLAHEGVTTDARLEEAVSGYDRVEALHAAASAQLRESQRRSREGVLRAPFDGVVTDALVEVGELVSPGQPLVRLAGEGGQEVLLEVPAELAGGLIVGASVAMRAVGYEADDPLARTPLEGTIRSVADRAASVSGLYPVIIDVTTPSARAGLAVEVALDGIEHDVLQVPLSAVLDPSGSRPFVWRARDGRAERAWIRLGRLDADRVEVREGLAVGDRVVVRGLHRLLEGDELAAGDPATDDARASVGGAR